MVPLMVATLTVVVTSQIAGIQAKLGPLLLVVPVYTLFAAVMLPTGMLAGKVAGVDTAGRRAIAWSGVTRNSLVVLPSPFLQHMTWHRWWLSLRRYSNS